MIGWIWRALVGRFSQCDHHWKTENVISVVDRVDGQERKYRRYVLQCTKCGEIKQKDIR